MTSNQLMLRSESKRLSRVWFAGVNPQEYTRIMKAQEVEGLSIPLLCDEILQAIRKVEKNNKQQLRVSFQELYYLMSGTIILYKSQVTFLYEQAIRQVQFSLEFVQQSHTTIVFKKPTKAVPKNNKRSRKNSNTSDYHPSKRIKVTVNTEFDWTDLKDIEVDNESTIQMLQTSKVMNRDQISLRDVMEEREDPFMDIDEFDVDENGSTQKFLEIRELIAHGRSIMHIFHNKNFNSVPVTDRNDEVNHQSERDEDEYRPLAYQQEISLPDIETYQQELEPEIVPHDVDNNDVDHEQPETVPVDVDNTIANREQPENSSRITVPAWLENDCLNNMPNKPKRATRVKKRRRRAFDTILQLKISEMQKPDVKLFRCLTPMLDSINEFDLLRHSQTRIFIKPSHVLKDLKPRYLKETPALMVGLQRVKRIKRQEQTDLRMVHDFLNSTCDQPLQDDLISKTIPQRVQSHHQEIPEAPQHENQYPPDELQDVPQDVPRDDHHDVPILSEFEIEPQPEPMDIGEPEYETNSRIVKQRQHQEMPLVVRNESPKTYQRVEVAIPRNILKVLNQFVTVESNQTASHGSQAMFVLKNQKNRQKWGLKGVLQNLLRLWNSNIHPIGMKELMFPHKQKLAAALAFYSIMELNSPRIGLILIEKYENSNTVFNIKKSPKLVNLLQNCK